MLHLPLHDAFAVASIVLSAATYLFDFGTNIAILVDYSSRYMRLLHREKEGISVCNAACHNQTSQLAGYFYAMLGVLVCCHSLNVLLFKLKFTHKEVPLFAAYFLPLIHLYRLCHLLWHTLSCKGIREIRSPEVNGLYCILGSAMEGVPMLILQFGSYLVLTRVGVFVHSISTAFKVSVAAALISAAYNGGTSVQSIAKNAHTLKQNLGAGMIGASFILSATLLRCLTITYESVFIRQYFLQNMSEREQAKYHVYDNIPHLIAAGIILAYLVYFWLLHSPRSFSKSLRSPRGLLTALAFSYMSIFLGPLYALVSQANDANQLGSYIFRVKLLTVSLLHLLLDLALSCVTYILGTLPKPYIIVSSVTAVVYMVSLIAYMKFDASCGPTTSLSTSIMPTPDGGSAVNEHTVVLSSELCMVTNAQAGEREKSEGDAVSQQVQPPSCQKADLARSDRNEGRRWPSGAVVPLETHIDAEAQDTAETYLQHSRSVRSLAFI